MALPASCRGRRAGLVGLGLLAGLVAVFGCGGFPADQAALPYRVLRGHRWAVHALAFTPDGQTLAAGGGLLGHGAELKLWDVASGTERRSLDGHSGAVAALAFSPQGDFLATGSEDTTVRLWDSTTGEARALLRGHTKAILGLSFTPDGKTLASASLDGTVRLWDLPSGSVRATLTDPDGRYRCVAFSPDGQDLATRTRIAREIELWDVATCAARGRLAGPTNVPDHPWGTLRLALGYLPGGLRTMSVRGDGSVELWDSLTPQVRMLRHPDSDGIGVAALSPDGRLVASGGWDGGVRLWEAATGEERAACPGHSRSVSALAFAADGKRLASGSYDQTVIVWELPERK